LKKLVLLTLLHLTPIIFANINSSHLNVSDGLPGTIVRKISQDEKGYMWFATKYGLAKYNGYEIEIIYGPDSNSLGDVWSLAYGPNKNLYIASSNQGLFKYQQNRIKKFNIFNDGNKTKITAIGFDVNKQLWLGTNNGIYKREGSSVKKIISYTNEKAYTILNLNNKELIVQTNKSIYQINPATESYIILESYQTGDELKYIINKDNYGDLWLGKGNGLYKFEKDCSCFKNYFSELTGKKVYSMTSDSENLWIGTLKNGLFRYSYQTHKLNKVSLLVDGDSSFDVMSLKIDKSGVLWIGTFHTGVFSITPNTLEFDLLSKDYNSSASCMDNFVIHDILETQDGTIWYATENGIVTVDPQNNCVNIKSNKNEIHSLSGEKVLSLSQSSNGDIWLLNSKNGIDKYSIHTHEINKIVLNDQNISFYFSVAYKKNWLLLGSHDQGLYKFDILNNQLYKIKNNDNQYDNASFYVYAKNSHDEYYLGSSEGVAKLNEQGELEVVDLSYNNRNNYSVSGIGFDNNDDLWFAANNQYLLKRNKQNIIENISDKILEKNKTIKVFAIVATGEDIIWISSDNGIYKINTKNYQNWHFVAKDGILNTEFLRNSFHKSQVGKIYFGGKEGVNSFFPDKITTNNNKPHVVLTAFNYFNKKLDVGVETPSNFKLDKPIDNLDHLVLGHKDYIIGFEFAALDYADTARNKYAYRLLGLNDQWVQTDATDRKVTYTNLKSGAYTFQVKAANKDGAWNETPRELKIRVKPAPWLTKWAFLLYFVTIILSIWAYIRFKTITSRKRAQQLEVTVNQRTQELSLQKKMVESLLNHKNEVFANVTHEFKTPLALILGPAQQLSDDVDMVQHSDKLNMIKRNAQRLILMVGQILKLSQVEQEKKLVRESQAVQPIVLMLFESFSPLANDKNIVIKLVNNYSTNIYATVECLEIVVGNLLSNALKFTASGGEITISTELNEKHISISVKDTGTGIKNKDLDKVFKRFTRLDTHKSIQGTGIGLTVVKEITEANDGEVIVNSVWGKGSEFTVVFPTTDVESGKELSQNMVDQLVSNVENELHVENKGYKLKGDNSTKKIKVLIIEDNLDMQAHIGNVLKNKFHCLFADRGRKGIALALEEVPDVVVCDVMMPGMDGYQVTRILRHDSRTSHIPIILLTALNTRESRIKGWREHIDIYVTKPFDATELNVQLTNIITIRNILQKKTNKALKTNGNFNTLDLTKQDLIFVEKLKNVIGKYYGNEYFQIADLASKMAVSGRQLQRKIRALLDESPMDMLRDYRLEKAALKLKEGLQVGLVSDECGFSSVSYFSSCFKKKYGVGAKRYQMLDKNTGSV
jgi:signal transduction histidine kinase/ligand-binding sensor domain-containing protein/DNA-binding NarL/FixJ family response regulator